MALLKATPQQALAPDAAARRQDRADFVRENQLQVISIYHGGGVEWQSVRPYRNVVVTSVFRVQLRFRGNLLVVGTVPMPSTWGLVACSDGTQNNSTRVSKLEDEAESEQQWTRIIGRMN